ncbi:hypothetical protein COLO4_35579 [Corchorus olitorius]|uniref:Uncharacterized protein n=1 Tax=Corchorus olitorius TaxID=93759 RepID=A0A1R3GF46_9ROSI|nr:hypothetical protein COLO4_35579 [Corchorus olitorius]
MGRWNRANRPNRSMSAWFLGSSRLIGEKPMVNSLIRSVIGPA